jgi:hypothetical protein
MVMAPCGTGLSGRRLIVFNRQSGNVVNNEWNTRLLSIAVSVSLVVAVKRFIVGLYLGEDKHSVSSMPTA